MKKETENYIVNDNAEIAESRIAELENRYIVPLKGVADAIAGLGLEATKETLYDAMFNNGEELESSYYEKNGIDKHANTLQDEILLERANAQLAKVRSAVSNVNGVTSTGANLKDPYLFNWVDVVDGTPKLSESHREEIRQSVIDEVRTPTGKRLCDLQRKCAADLQTLADEMQKIEDTEGKTLSLKARLAKRFFPGGLFDVKLSDNNEIIISARRINFDPQEIED